MTLQNALNLKSSDFEKMDMKELRKTANTLFSGTNKRIKRLEKAEDIAQDALNRVKREGGRFSSKGKDKDELIEEIRRAQRFGKDPTSTVSGAKKKYKERQGNGITGRENSIIETYNQMVEDGEVPYRTKSQIVRDVLGFAEENKTRDLNEYSDKEIVFMIVGEIFPDEDAESLDDIWGDVE